MFMIIKASEFAEDVSADVQGGALLFCLVD
jgi:hypothetical protein